MTKAKHFYASDSGVIYVVYSWFLVQIGGLWLTFKKTMGLVYCAGLFWTYVALNVMVGSGQPALLYIVPCTLGIVISSLSYSR